MLYLQFLISSALIVFAGVKLTVCADVLSDRIKLGKVFIGVVLLGFVTSLPEAVASLTAVVSLKANDLAIGNMLGSNNFNPMLVVVMDLIYRKGPVTDQISFSREHIIPGVFAVLLTAVVAVEILLGGTLRLPEFLNIGLGAWVVFAVYFIGMKMLAGAQGKQDEKVIEKKFPDASNESLKKIIIQLVLSAVLVVVAAMWLANIADRLAERTGLGETFVGSIFLAVVTSLPEMVVTVSALKMGGFGLAMGNIFGSNMTNMFLIGFCDLVYREGAILSTVSKTHIITAVLSVILTGIVYLGIKFKNKKKFILAWDTALMTAVFFIGLGILYQYR